MHTVFNPEQHNKIPTQPLNLNVQLTDLTTFKCSQCEHKLFEPFFIIKKLSALQSPDGKEKMLNVQVFACANCGHVPNEFGGNLVNDK